MTFSQVERLTGPLPLEARTSQSWWTAGAAAQAIAARGWRIRSVDMTGERISLARSETARIGASAGPEAWRELPVENVPGEAVMTAMDAAHAPTPTATTSASRFQRYVGQLHVPLVAVLLFLCVVFGALGFGLRPGTDRPPAVPSDRIQLYVWEQTSQHGAVVPSRVNVEEILIQQSPGVVELQVDFFGTFQQTGQATWRMLFTGISLPRSCPDLTHYLGTSYGDPLADGSIDGHLATASVVSNFEGRDVPQAAANHPSLEGHPPGTVAPEKQEALGEIDLCWSQGAPLAFNGEYAAVSIPTVSVKPGTGTSVVPVGVTRSLYFVNKTESAQPVTAEYSLQAGTLPTSTDPIGWHWSADNGGPIQLVALNIPESQHETYLGFLSGVLFGIAGGALVTLLQEVLDPLRGRRKTRPAEEKAS